MVSDFIASMTGSNPARDIPKYGRGEPVELSNLEKLRARTMAGLRKGLMYGGITAATTLVGGTALGMMYAPQVGLGAALTWFLEGPGAVPVVGMTLAAAPTAIAFATGFGINAFSEVPEREALALKKRSIAEKLMHEERLVSRADAAQQKLEAWEAANEQQSASLLHGLPMEDTRPRGRYA